MIITNKYFVKVFILFELCKRTDGSKKKKKKKKKDKVSAITGSVPVPVLLLHIILTPTCSRMVSREPRETRSEAARYD